jgi:hypothetical protein
MRFRVSAVVASLSLAACSTGAGAVVRDDAADRLKCHPRQIIVSERQDIALGAYQATGCGSAAIFRCHTGAGGLVDCTPDVPLAEQPAPVAPPPQPGHPLKSNPSPNAAVSDGTNLDPLNGSLK